MFMYVPNPVLADDPTQVLAHEEEIQIDPVAQEFVNNVHNQITALHSGEKFPTTKLDLVPLISDLIAQIEANPALLPQYVKWPGISIASPTPLYLVFAQMLWRPSYFHPEGYDQDPAPYIMQLWEWLKNKPEAFAFDQRIVEAAEIEHLSRIIGDWILVKASTQEIITTLSKLCPINGEQVIRNLSFYFRVYGTDGRFDADQKVAMIDFLNSMRFAGICTESNIHILRQEKRWISRNGHLIQIPQFRGPLYSDLFITLPELYNFYIQHALRGEPVVEFIDQLFKLTSLVNERENALALAQAIICNLDPYPLVANMQTTECKTKVAILIAGQRDVVSRLTITSDKLNKRVRSLLS